jgi:hypothetical protein
MPSSDPWQFPPLPLCGWERRAAWAHLLAVPRCRRDGAFTRSSEEGTRGFRGVTTEYATFPQDAVRVTLHHRLEEGSHGLGEGAQSRAVWP